MDEFYELEFIGRGGQGAKTASELVAKIALNKGKFVQSFPDYGPERKGAPVRAFTRIADSEIRGCSSEANPNILVIIDPTLLPLNGTLFNITPDMIVVVNSSDTPDTIKKNLNVKGNIYSVDATQIVLDILKVNIPNSAMLGALAKTTDIFTINDIKDEFNKEFEEKLGSEKVAQNYQVIDKAYSQVRN